jgi:two-component system, NtrC family, sensor histidine kinase HydH
MWRQVALPVIVIALCWLAVSGSTNFYLQWLDDSYQQVFDENIASMHAASLVQQEIWRLHAELTSQSNRDMDWSQRLKAFDDEVQSALQTLVERAGTNEERVIAASIVQLTQQYRTDSQSMLTVSSRQATARAAPQDRLFALAVEISEKSDRIRQINDELLQANNQRRTKISQIVLWTRGIAITLVPALGIALGWWTATRLERSVASIQVTLHDPLLAGPDHLGTVDVRGGTDLASIQQQVQFVVDRLRQTGQQLQAARQEVLRAERLAAIGGLAAGVAHELRNPLTSVKLLLQHAATRGGDATIGAPKMELILDEVERMETTIQGLLDFSRPAQPQRKLYDLRETIDRALHLISGQAEKQHVATDAELGEDALMIYGDPQQLHQVFVNLLINAVEAMPDGGQLEITANRPHGNHAVQVYIRDTGDGIPPDLMPRLFEPFASGKERGTGLGLAVSRRILEEHGGTISARSASPSGTIFVVKLPTASSPALVPESVGLM